MCTVGCSLTIVKKHTQNNIGKSNRRSHLQCKRVRTHSWSCTASVHSITHFPSSLPDKHIQTYGKTTSTDLFVLAIVFTNQYKSWTHIWYKALFCYHANFRCHIGPDHINISCHSFQPLFLPSLMHFDPIAPSILLCRLSPPCFLPILSRVIWDRHEQDFHIR